MINKGATKAATLEWTYGGKTIFWVDHNRNTGKPIVWQVVWRDGKPGPSSRLTGGNLARLANELRLLDSFEGRFIRHNDAASRIILP